LVEQSDAVADDVRYDRRSVAGSATQQCERNSMKRADSGLVDVARAVVPTPSARSRRRISAAASRVNVMASTRDGSTSPCAMRHAIR
jgi:hypothetical protein